MKNFQKVGAYMGAGVGMVLTGLGLSNSAHAAADAGVTAAAESVATVISENVIASVTAILPDLVLAGALILIIFVAWRFGKRFVR